jgi:uncharacterized protein YjlB
MSAATTIQKDIETYRFDDAGDIPNNPGLPLLVYRGVLPLDGDAASACEKLFSANAWPNAWRNGVYDYHHFHTKAHEALGIVRGEVRVRFGGPNGLTAAARAGDVVVIPAGVAHKNEGASADLLIIGAYPPGQTPDTLTRADARSRPTIAALPRPTTDPVYGAKGPLLLHWSHKS